MKTQADLRKATDETRRPVEIPAAIKGYGSTPLFYVAYFKVGKERIGQDQRDAWIEARRLHFDIDIDSGERVIFEITGNINDQASKEVGRGASYAEAIDQAMMTTPRPKEEGQE